MKYKIDRFTPIPPPTRQPRKSTRLSILETMRDMPVDADASFLVPLKGRDPQKVRGSITASGYAIRQQHPERKYVTRLIRKEKGIRVWRVR